MNDLTYLDMNLNRFCGNEMITIQNGDAKSKQAWSISKCSSVVKLNMDTLFVDTGALGVEQLTWKL